MLDRFWSNYSIRYFTLVTVALVVLFAGWAATGRPFPGQRLGVTAADLNKLDTIPARLQFGPDVPGTVDPRDYIPIVGFNGLANTFSDPNGAKIVTFVGIDRSDPNPEIVTSATTQPWTLERGDRYGYAVVWQLPGHRYAGMVLWAPNDLAAPDNLEQLILAATADAAGPGPQDQR